MHAFNKKQNKINNDTNSRMDVKSNKVHISYNCTRLDIQNVNCMRVYKVFSLMDRLAAAENWHLCVCYEVALFSTVTKNIYIETNHAYLH